QSACFAGRLGRSAGTGCGAGLRQAPRGSNGTRIGRGAPVRICLIGKFPPFRGGVSMRTYWAAHALATRGHEVHVVTNAKEVHPPFRMHMRAEGWRRCEASYGEGSVTVHWTDLVDRSQTYIPMPNPFVSKLAGIAVRGVSSCDGDGLKRVEDLFAHGLISL